MSLVHWLAGRTGRKAERRFRVRIVVQVVFALTCVLLGIQFARFYHAARAGATPLPTRPAGVEGFLPISGIMGFVDWLWQGTLNAVHPAATVLVLVAILMAVLLRKSFCSWVCPIGFLSELLARFGRWSFGRNFRLWRWVDLPLRSLKYVLMAFFLGSIALMGEAGLRAFIESPYNRVADLKMGLFFAHMGRTALWVTGGLLIGSIFVRGLWCRYLCPYGALLGLFSWMSPTKIRREADACVGCSLCDRACGARIDVSGSRAVTSVECTGCLDCVAACPVKGALTVKVGRRPVRPLAYAAAVTGLFLAGYVGARATGIWQNGLNDAEYVQRVQEMNSPVYGHPGIGGR
jgi:polyferredoxin